MDDLLTKMIFVDSDEGIELVVNKAKSLEAGKGDFGDDIQEYLTWEGTEALRRDLMTLHGHKSMQRRNRMLAKVAV